MGIENLAKIAKKNNMPKDQLVRFLQAGYVPQEKQVRYHAACREADQPGGPTEIGFGGARGPGKSHAMLAQIAVDDCQRIPDLKCLLLRRVGKAVREAFEDLRWKVLNRTPHEYNKSSGTVKFPNGSRIIMGHFQSDRDIDSYLGLEYDVIGVEEATTLSNSKYKAIRTCNRTSKQDFRPRIYTNANPGGVGHQWYKNRFVIPYERGEETETRFIPATIFDNVYINDGYQKNLEALTGWKKRAWLNGDWDILGGSFFDHIETVPNQGIPKYWPYVWLAMDYGWTHPTAVVLLAQNNEGVTYLVDEYAESKRLVKTHAANINQMLKRNKVDEIYSFVAGGDMWMAGRDGRCVAEDYQEYFPMLERADMGRISGAANLLELLGSPKEGIEPKLKIYENCKRTISQLRSMQHDPNRPDDVMKVDINEDGNGGDDLYDALRYGAMVIKDMGKARLRYEEIKY